MDQGALVNLSAAELARFQRRLLGWYARRRRGLPWRRTRDPYSIWLSDVMLQQTRVAAVLPFYRRFIARFPTVHALARARPEQVLRFWAGLGYYSRARNLHRAAKQIVARHAGRFPREFDATLRLPGVGAYTAAAVLSMAYGQPCAVLDGNVARVLARLGAVRGDLRASRRWRQLQETAQTLLAVRAPGDSNQAMMELGATVCTPRAPQCHACPVSRWCQAFRLGLAERLPAPRRKRPPERVTLAAAVLLDPRGRTLLVKPSGEGAGGPDGALFSRLWQFPAVRVSGHKQEEWLPRAEAELGRHLLSLFSHTSASRPRGELQALAPARHTVTFREITLAPFLLHVARLPAIPGARKLLLARLDRLPISSATRKIAAAVQRAASSPSPAGSRRRASWLPSRPSRQEPFSRQC